MGINNKLIIRQIMQEQDYGWLLEGCHTISVVARAYAPSEHSISSTRSFRRTLKRYSRLYSELLDAEYTDSTSVMTPLQISILVRHWGLPVQARIEAGKIKKNKCQQDIF